MGTFRLACPQCGADIEADESLVGRNGKCDQCGHKFTVSRPEVRTFGFTCPHCQATMDAEEGWIGQVAQCPSCGQDLTVQKPATPLAVPALLPPTGGDTSLTEEQPTAPDDSASAMRPDSSPPLFIPQPPLPPTPQTPGDLKQCPACGKQIKAKAKLCRFCQADLSQPPVAVLPACGDSSAQPGEHSLEAGAPKRTNWRIRPAIAIGVGASVLVLATLATLALRHGTPSPERPWTVPELGIALVWVAPGSFQMGSDKGAANEMPVHTARITEGFWLGRCEVTQAEYEAVMGVNPSFVFRGASLPVAVVSWGGAMAFCTELTAREQRAGRLPKGYEYRLPTEAEWEYAARGGQASKGYTYSGSNNVDEVAWYYGNSGYERLDDAETDSEKRSSNLSGNGSRTHPVGQKKPNELGLYDMSGNVWEWCLDWFAEGYYAASPGTDPVNLQAGTHRVGRGGCWSYASARCRVASRASVKSSDSDPTLGFRACLAPALAATTEATAQEAAEGRESANLEKARKQDGTSTQKARLAGVKEQASDSSTYSTTVQGTCRDNGADLKRFQELCANYPRSWSTAEAKGISSRLKSQRIILQALHPPPQLQPAHTVYLGGLDEVILAVDLAIEGQAAGDGATMARAVRHMVVGGKLVGLAEKSLRADTVE